ncbi:MAG: hypothetical protein SNJ57_19680 [Cyanobacteriota bacterium]
MVVSGKGTTEGDRLAVAKVGAIALLVSVCVTIRGALIGRRPEPFLADRGRLSRF